MEFKRAVVRMFCLWMSEWMNKWMNNCTRWWEECEQEQADSFWLLPIHLLLFLVSVPAFLFYGIVHLDLCQPYCQAQAQWTYCNVTHSTMSFACLHSVWKTHIHAFQWFNRCTCISISWWHCLMLCLHPWKRFKYQSKVWTQFLIYTNENVWLNFWLVL